LDNYLLLHEFHLFQKVFPYTPSNDALVVKTAGLHNMLNVANRLKRLGSRIIDDPLQPGRSLACFFRD
jgi:hypothetical protein